MFSTLIRAPAIGPPCFSETFPVIDPLVACGAGVGALCVCAKERAGKIHAKHRAKRNTKFLGWRAVWQDSRKIFMYGSSYSFNNSRRRFVCARDTGISLARLSFIFSMKLDLNHGTTSLM